MGAGRGAGRDGVASTGVTEIDGGSWDIVADVDGAGRPDEKVGRDAADAAAAADGRGRGGWPG